MFYEATELTLTTSRYALSKLFQVFVTQHLASAIDPLPNNFKDPNAIVINLVSPGMCKTDLDSNLSAGVKAVRSVVSAIFAKNAEEGSRIIVIAASAGRDSHGGYLMGAGTLSKYAPMIVSDVGIKDGAYIWNQMQRKLEEIQPGLLASTMQRT